MDTKVSRHNFLHGSLAVYVYRLGVLLMML